jgi:hypothetical protein
VDADTRVLTDHRMNAPVAFLLRRGETVRALTGMVITAKLGVAYVRNPSSVNGTVYWYKPGERLAVINYVGEGQWKFWLRGQFDDAGMETQKLCRSPSGVPECQIEIIAEPQTVWWAKIRKSDGREGWTRDTAHFGNKDSCG